jgi:hypothetical protein
LKNLTIGQSVAPLAPNILNNPVPRPIPLANPIINIVEEFHQAKQPTYDLSFDLEDFEGIEPTATVNSFDDPKPQHLLLEIMIKNQN